MILGEMRPFFRMIVYGNIIDIGMCQIWKLGVKEGAEV